MNNQLIITARNFAIISHEACGHKRKYTSEPYWFHLERVAKIVEHYHGTDAMIAAAWLHDVIEDTHITENMIRDYFGYGVSLLVAGLTNNKTVDRKTRKELEIERFRSVSGDCCTIKLADILDNGLCFLSSGDKRAIDTFMREKAELIKVLKNGGNKQLYSRVFDMIEGHRVRDYFL